MVPKVFKPLKFYCIMAAMTEGGAEDLAVLCHDLALSFSAFLDFAVGSSAKRKTDFTDYTYSFCQSRFRSKILSVARLPSPYSDVS